MALKFPKKFFCKIARLRRIILDSYKHSFPKMAAEPSEHVVPHLNYITRDQYSTSWESSLHTHTCAEFFFITDGHGRFRTQYEEFPVAIHDLIIINANVPHTELSQAENPLKYIILGVENLEAITGAEGYIMLHLHSGWKELTHCLHLMIQEAYESQPGYEEACQHLLQVVLLRLKRQITLSFSDEALPSRSSRDCDLIRRYIDNHFKENISLDQLARLAHMNKYYLVHTFKKEFGTSPINYLITKRIDESRFLLRETNHSLSTITQMLGFSSLSYFSQCFRRAEGISPGKYRQQNQ